MTIERIATNHSVSSMIENREPFLIKIFGGKLPATSIEIKYGRKYDDFQRMKIYFGRGVNSSFLTNVSSGNPYYTIVNNWINQVVDGQYKISSPSEFRFWCGHIYSPDPRLQDDKVLRFFIDFTNSKINQSLMPPSIDPLKTIIRMYRWRNIGPEYVMGKSYWDAYVSLIRRVLIIAYAVPEKSIEIYDKLNLLKKYFNGEEFSPTIYGQSFIYNLSQFFQEITRLWPVPNLYEYAYFPETQYDIGSILRRDLRMLGNIFNQKYFDEVKMLDPNSPIQYLAGNESLQALKSLTDVIEGQDFKKFQIIPFWNEFKLKNIDTKLVENMKVDIASFNKFREYFKSLFSENSPLIYSGKIKSTDQFERQKGVYYTPFFTEIAKAKYWFEQIYLKVDDEVYVQKGSLTNILSKVKEEIDIAFSENFKNNSSEFLTDKYFTDLKPELTFNAFWKIIVWSNNFMKGLYYWMKKANFPSSDLETIMEGIDITQSLLVERSKSTVSSNEVRLFYAEYKRFVEITMNPQNRERAALKGAKDLLYKNLENIQRISDNFDFIKSSLGEPIGKFFELISNEQYEAPITLKPITVITEEKEPVTALVQAVIVEPKPIVKDEVVSSVAVLNAEVVEPITTPKTTVEEISRIVETKPIEPTLPQQKKEVPEPIIRKEVMEEIDLSKVKEEAQRKKLVTAIGVGLASLFFLS